VKVLSSGASLVYHHSSEFRCYCGSIYCHKSIVYLVGQIRVGIRVKVRINGQCLVYRYTCNNRVRIKISIRVRVSFMTGMRIACHYVHRVNSNANIDPNPNPNSD